jgi:hypothetical protein
LGRKGEGRRIRQGKEEMIKEGGSTVPLRYRSL